MRKPPVIVIGAGLGGLSAAIHLAAAGRRVIVLEAGRQPGGKCDWIGKDGYHFDLGPSVLTLPHVLEELFRVAGRAMGDYLEIEPVEPGCRYFFADGSTFDAPGTLDAFEAAVARDFPADLTGFRRFRREIEALWRVSGPAFLENPFDHRVLGRIPWATALRQAWAFRPGSMHGRLSRFFRDPRLIQLFSRFATYNGSDPYRCPATFNVIAHAELGFGSWRCRGGMASLPRALARLAGDLGVEIHTGQTVEGIRFDRHGQPEAVRLTGGAETACAAVVCNQDAATAVNGPLLDGMPGVEKLRRRWSRRETSSSGFVLLLGLKGTRSPLACHNVLFPPGYRDEFRDLFGAPRPLRDPTLYISIPSRAEPTLAPEGAEGWFVLVNAPSLDRVPAWDTEAYADSILAALRARLPFPLDPATIEFRHAHGPAFFRDRYRAWQGSLYGFSSNRTLSAFLRARNGGNGRGLAFAGGTAHPGGGIPLVLLSGRHAARAVFLSGNRPAHG